MSVEPTGGREYEFRVVCPDGVVRYENGDDQHVAASWATFYDGPNSHRDCGPGHRIERRTVTRGEWEPFDEADDG